MYSFPYLEPVCCSMSSSNCCFLACIQISQEAGQLVWYSHLLKNFPQFVVIHTVKGFGIDNKAEVNVFLELSCFLSEKALATHWSTLAWKIPWAEEPGRLQSMGSLRLSVFTFTFHFHALQKEIATHSSIFTWRIPGTGEPGRLPSMGSHRVRHNWSDLAAAACFFDDPMDVGNLILVPLPFLNPGWTSGSSQFTYCWSLAWRILSITLLAGEMSVIVW